MYQRPYLSPYSTCCVTSRHDTSRQARRVALVVTWRAVSCVLRRACSNMANDEEAAVLVCKTISYLIIYYFSPQMNLIRLLKGIPAIITLYTLQTKLRIAPFALVVTDLSRLLRSSWRAVTCCFALAVQHARHSTYDFFKYRNAWARYRVEVSSCDATSGIWALVGCVLHSSTLTKLYVLNMPL